MISLLDIYRTSGIKLISRADTQKNSSIFIMIVWIRKEGYAHNGYFSKCDLCMICYIDALHNWKLHDEMFCFQHLTRLYLDKATLVWNGNAVTGQDALSDFFDTLPSSEFQVQTLDCQPVHGIKPVILIHMWF